MTDELCAEYRKALLELTFVSIEHGFHHHEPAPVDLEKFAPPLRERRATFVTLRLSDELQGCIGTLRPVRPLAADVARNAYAAAFDDPRGRVLSESDLRGLHIHISLLGHPEPLAFESEEDLLRKVRPGIDGLILEESGRCGTLLPSVWEHLRDPREFVCQLKLKAGLPLDYWSSNVKILRYSTESFSN